MHYPLLMIGPTVITRSGHLTIRLVEISRLHLMMLHQPKTAGFSTRHPHLVVHQMPSFILTYIGMGASDFDDFSPNDIANVSVTMKNYVALGNGNLFFNVYTSGNATGWYETRYDVADDLAALVDAEYVTKTIDLNINDHDTVLAIAFSSNSAASTISFEFSSAKFHLHDGRSITANYQPSMVRYNDTKTLYPHPFHDQQRVHPRVALSSDGKYLISGQVSSAIPSQ